MTDYPFPLWGRGVYPAPCLGPNGETILFAIRSDHRLIPRELGGVRYVLPGDNPYTAIAELREILDELDPAPALITAEVA